MRPGGTPSLVIHVEIAGEPCLRGCHRPRSARRSPSTRSTPPRTPNTPGTIGGCRSSKRCCCRSWLPSLLIRAMPLEVPDASRLPVRRRDARFGRVIGVGAPAAAGVVCSSSTSSGTRSRPSSTTARLTLSEPAVRAWRQGRVPGATAACCLPGREPPADLCSAGRTAGLERARIAALARPASLWLDR